MHKLACFNQDIKPASEIFLPAISSAAFYGKSIFTTIAIYHDKPFQWKKHWQRLKENAARLDIGLDNFSEAQIKNLLSKLISENDFQNARARLTFFDDSASGIWSIGKKEKINLLITTANFREKKDDLHLTVSPFSINSKSPLAGIKSGNYLENILAFDEAKRRGFDEAVRLNEKGEIVSAAMANIFLLPAKIFLRRRSQPAR